MHEQWSKNGLMKILQILTELGGGGAEKTVALLAEQQHSAGHDVTVLSLKGPPVRTEIPDR